MEKNILKKAAIQSLALMLSVILLSYAIKLNNSVAISASNIEDKSSYTPPAVQNTYQEPPTTVSEPENDTIEDIEISQDIVKEERPSLIFTDATTDINIDILEQLGEKYIVIRKPQGEGLELKLEDIYIDKSLKLIISGIINEEIDNNYIGRVNNEEVFIGEPMYTENEVIEEEEDGTITSTITKEYGNDPIYEILITSQADELGHNIQEIQLQLDHVYVHIIYEDDYYYYIDLKRPKEVYDKIIVIDAGHGGRDPGALSKDELTYEKTINLKVLLELKKILDDKDIKAYYTRTLDDRLFLRQRVTLANDVDSDMFISIHCNSNGHSSKINGMEILYYNYEHKGVASKKMAKLFSEEIAGASALKNNGILQMKNDDVFILHHATVPAILVETGYMSNKNDLEYLLTEAGQIAIAEGIYKGIIRAYEELMPYEQAVE